MASPFVAPGQNPQRKSQKSLKQTTKSDATRKENQLEDLTHPYARSLSNDEIEAWSPGTDRPVKDTVVKISTIPLILDVVNM